MSTESLYYHLVMERKAHEDAARLMSYWFDKGFIVKAHVERTVVGGNAVFTVRSDMVNGLPKDYKNGKS